jgi:hypothetical protein
VCLEIIATIAPDAKARISAKRLSELSGLRVASCKFDGLSALHFSVTGGCSCEFLSGNAEFESETWVLASDHLPALAQALSILAKETRRFSFIARWMTGERQRRTEKIRSAQLVKLVTENRVGNNVLYESAG